MIWHLRRCTKATVLLVLWAGSLWADVPIQAASVQERALLRQTEAQVRRYFRTTFGVEVTTPFALVGAGDAEALLSQVQAAQSAGGWRVRRKPLNAARVCPSGRIGGAANRTFIALCWPMPVTGGAGYHGLRLSAGAVLAHEYIHQLQYDLAQDRPAQRLGDYWLLGPAWLVEGTAEVFEEHYRTGGAAVDGAALFNMQSSARRSRLTLDQMRATGALADGQAYGVARFAAFLLSGRYGPDALLDYFAALGRTKDQDAAFLAAFGTTMVAFESDFEAVRRDFGAAKAYVGME